MHSSVKSKKSVSPAHPAETHFQQNILKWYKKNTRSYPWIGVKDPYRVWLSEIILQQTRVEQGLPYYNRILAHFPTIGDLAAAEEQLVFRLWQGLGYYNRCKNMLAAARVVCEAYNGVFPDDYDAILGLPGVGPYTAAAISSFAFDRPHAVVDGNVERLLSRYFGLEVAVNTAKGKKTFHTLASRLLNRKQPARYNQAIMDFGATVCLPRQPLCAACPFREHCVAHKKGMIEKLPVKMPKKPVKNRYLHYFVFRYEDKVFIRRRPAAGIWQNLHEFVLFEHRRAQTGKMLFDTPVFQAAIADNVVLQQSCSPLYIHQLTHQKLHIRFLQVFLKYPPRLPEEFFPLEISRTDLFAFPRPLVKYMASLENL